ncbi:MAG TPA: hypothetical protein VE201_01160 [Nitrospirales bacterium]|nr:hypothetical protein [Nitrospirales bacterium]
MRRLAIIGALSACLLGGASVEVMADEQTEKALEERVKRLEKLVEELTKHGVKEATEECKEKNEKGECKEKQEKTAAKPLDLSSPGGGKLIYAKPFVSSPKATVGGYMDLQYRLFNSSNSTGVGQSGNGQGSSTFDQQRFVPFFYSDITDRIKVASEVEIEHGIRSKSNDGSSIEVSVEFATIDYLITEPINLRAGIILLPVGKFNLLHDSPLNELADRPLVATAVIPSTLSETGAGFYGTVYPSRLSKVDYELYVTQGFNGYRKDRSPVITADAGLRDARQRVSTVDDGLDNNDGKAVVGRVAFSPILGVEVGGSGYFGSYDPASKRPLSIWAADWTFQRGPFRLIGEAAWVYARDNNRTLDGGFALDANGRPLPRRMDGFYIEGDYHFMPDTLRRWAPSHFTEASTFTAVVRWDEANTNSEFADTARQRLTLGLNFRPISDTVFRADYQFNFEDGKNNRIRNDGLVLSVATYF